MFIGHHDLGCNLACGGDMPWGDAQWRCCDGVVGWMSMELSIGGLLYVIAALEGLARVSICEL